MQGIRRDDEIEAAAGEIFEAIRKADPWLPRESKAGAFETPGIGIDDRQPSAVRICQSRRVPRQRPMANLQDT